MSDVPASAKPQGCTWLRLRKLARRMTQRYDRHLRGSGLKITQFSLLAALSGGEAFTMSALAERLAMDRTTLTRNLKPLLEAGLVGQASASDGRCRAISLTAAGRSAFDGAYPLWRQAQREMQQTLGAEQLYALHTMLDQTLLSLGEEPHQEAPLSAPSSAPAV